MANGAVRSSPDRTVACFQGNTAGGLVSADATSLSNLRDIVLPPPVSWWPLAWGWYLVAALLLAGLAWGLVRRWRRRRANRYRELALLELDALSAAIADAAKRPRALAALPVLLKRVALAAWPRGRVAGLSGEAWWHFLDESGADSALGKVQGPRLDRLSYGREPDAGLSESETKRLLQAVRAWIRSHRAPEQSGR
jgi:hypothetical protein